VFSFTGSDSDIVIIPLTDDSCVYIISEMNDNNIRTTSCKREHIYTAVISERNDNNIRTTSCKREHIYTAVISEMNDNNIVLCLQEVVLILLSFLSLMSAVYICSVFTGSGYDIVIIPLTDGSCRNDNNIRTTSCKREHIYIAAISKRNDNNIITTSCKNRTYIQKWF
jgi:hypothetical protein